MRLLNRDFVSEFCMGLWMGVLIGEFDWGL